MAPRHPFIDRAVACRTIADYVTTESGTGAVHTAPGHGAEDYQTGLHYGLEIYCPVADNGTYVDDGRIPAELVGVTTLESVEDLAKKKTSPANIAVLRKLDAAGALFAKQKFTHSYPHCWRSKTPIIFRAVDQWFVGLDRSGMRSTALSEISKIAAAGGWIPAWGEAPHQGAPWSRARTGACVSRQRSSRVPVPAFYDSERKKGRHSSMRAIIRAVADKVEESRPPGSNLWFESAPAEGFLAGIALPAGWPGAGGADACGRDTLDVWLDSGLLARRGRSKRGKGGSAWPADLYLSERQRPAPRLGSQSSLWTSRDRLWCGALQGGA